MSKSPSVPTVKSRVAVPRGSCMSAIGHGVIDLLSTEYRNFYGEAPDTSGKNTVPMMAQRIPQPYI